VRKTLTVWSDHFRVHHAVYWANLGRAANLLVVLNVSLFFVSGLVTKYGYYYTYYSLLLLIPTYLGLLLPIGRIDRLGHYVLALLAFSGAWVFLGLSVVYWVGQGGMHPFRG